MRSSEQNVSKKRIAHFSEIEDEIERSQADAVVLSAGCPMCHRVVVAAQREIESRGVPTVVVTVVPETLLPSLS